MTTPRGVIETQHVVHATNAWASHLLPGMRERIIPLRGVVNAQTPRAGLEWAGTRAFVFYPSDSMDVLDYMTQQPMGGVAGSKYPSPLGEVMLGGGVLLSKGWIEDVGNTDDGGWNPDTGRHLAGALDGYFGARVGDVAAVWSGIMGMSTDEMPWVGRVPEWISGRASGDAGPGEWIAAGYSGEGMAHSWLSGRAVAEMIGGSGGKVPAAMGVGRERWAATGLEEAVLRMGTGHVRK